jgi:hypothetical protein
MDLKVTPDLGVGSVADFCEAEGAGDLVVGGLLLQTAVSLRPGSWIMSIHRYVVTSINRYIDKSLHPHFVISLRRYTFPTFCPSCRLYQMA